MIKRSLIIWVAIIVTVATVQIIIHRNDDKKNVDGGPCVYTVTNHPAEILKFTTPDSVFYDAICRVTTDGHADTLSYHQESKKMIGKAELGARHLQVGGVLRYEEHTIKKGACTPHYFVLTLEPYSTP